MDNVTTKRAERPDKDSDTRDRLLAAALRIFADRGIETATLREITVEADANVAAVNYYFRTKEELIRTALETCLKPINNARLLTLQRCIDKSPDGLPALEEIIEALVRPMVELSADQYGGRAPVRLLMQVRALPKPATNSILAEQFDLIHRRFLDALGKALPHLSKEAVGFRYDFARGAIMQILGDLDPAARDMLDLEFKQKSRDSDVIIRELVTFISAGFRA